MSLVVLGHLAQVYLEKVGGGGAFPALEALLCLIYFFHMPLFVFVSGVFSKNAPKRRDRAFADLFVPFLAAQALWLVWLAVAESPRYALSQALTPQFALWYLVALFAWRLALPDLARVRFILPVSAALFFFGQLFGGIDNTLAIQRTLGFLFFFLLGYRLDPERVLRTVVRIPVAIAVAAFVVVISALYVAFASGRIPYGTVFSVLTHGAHIDESTGYVMGLAVYSVAFVGAVVLSACFLRLIVSLKHSRVLVRIGSDTMPLYLAHGYAVHAICSLFALAPVLSDPVAIGIFIVAALAIVTLFSTKFWRSVYESLAARCRNAIFGPEERR